MQILTNTISHSQAVRGLSRQALVAPAPQASLPTAGDQVTLSAQSRSTEGGFVASYAPFAAAMAGTGIGMALAIAEGSGGLGFFVKTALGALGGFAVGEVVSALSDGPKNRALPAPLATIKNKAMTIGTVTGLGIGLAYAVAGNPIHGGTLFVNSALGAIGGAVVGSIIEET